MSGQTADDRKASNRATPGDYVLQLLRSLELLGDAGPEAKLDERSIEAFTKRESEFEWVHLGNSELRIERLVGVLQKDSDLLPPRTGHIGNWSNIVRGCAGARDYNYIAVSPQRLGYPLILDSNQTEAEAPGVGDWSYMPGSIVDGRERRKLNLFTWDGTSFRKRERKDPLFTPFTLADNQGELVPLTRLHRDRLTTLGDFRFQSTLFKDHEECLRSMLHVLLEDARHQERPERLLGRIFDRYVSRDARVTRTAVEPCGAGFRMGAIRYAGAHEIVDHAVLPVSLAAQPESFVKSVDQLPEQMPLLSNGLVHLLYAILHSHYPDLDEVPSPMTHPCNPHLHWGGIPMAGYPPCAHGYFRSLARYLRRLCRPIIRQMAEIDPVLYVLLPAGLFNLCPNDALPQDVDFMAMLMKRVRTATDGLAGKPGVMFRRIEQLVDELRPTAEMRLSRYMIGRLSPSSGVRPIADLPDGKPAMLPSFTELSIQQASMLLGALTQVTWAKQAAS